jgi:hypothetical protein
MIEIPPEAQVASKGLTAKLAEIMGLVERVPKNGWNEFHKYAFATESDVVEAVSTLLAERRISINPNVTSYERRPKEGSTKGGFVTDIMVKWTLRDGDSGETEDSLVPGCGEDSGDKGCAKALTMSKKYFLTLRFLIPTGDDPERDAQPATPSASPHAAAYAASPLVASLAARDPGTPSERQVRDYKLNPQQYQPNPAAPATDGGTFVTGKFGEVSVSADGNCWFVEIGKTNTWTRDATLAGALVNEHGKEVSAHVRMKPGGKAYQLLSYVPKD